ncbi:hypothetical protein [Leptolyngbya sp. 'hensonii']|nr:hypothetical protein [Leptolyngbya sp. 'hensonii']
MILPHKRDVQYLWWHPDGIQALCEVDGFNAPNWDQKKPGS